MLKFFKRKDPICGMAEEKGRGMTKYRKWFCSKDCLSKYEKGMNGFSHSHGCGCCH